MSPRATPPNASDHDLLIRIDTKVDLLHSTVQETRTALSARIDRLAQDKANYTDLDPLRKSIESLQKKDEELQESDNDQNKKIYIATGALAVLQLALPLIYYWLTHSKG